MKSLEQVLFDLLKPTIVRTYHDTDQPKLEYVTSEGPKSEIGLLTAIRRTIENYSAGCSFNHDHLRESERCEYHD